MDAIQRAIRAMIDLSDEELTGLLQRCHEATFQRGELLSETGKVPDKIFFIAKGLVRVALQDNSGTEHTLHFAMENQFIADYAQFIQKQPALYTLQALEETQTVVLPRAAVEWGYQNMREGQKLGRLIAEYYFIYQDNRINNTYLRSPRERYDQIADIFPNIHNRAPQHMLASYLGISSVHLSRLKKQGRQKT
jgi:CRP-like cAMP-binding protein